MDRASRIEAVGVFPSARGIPLAVVPLCPIPAVRSSEEILIKPGFAFKVGLYDTNGAEIGIYNFNPGVSLANT
ncbi:MAG: hypothetical protein Q8S31_09600, partial [Alphaproteobacteria bacterium]|nr:hypothetical protein [Alphaproteobacteria bacterium]